MHIQRKALNFYRIFSDVIAIIASFFVCILIPFRPEVVFWGDATEYVLVIVILVWLFSSRATNLYDEFRSQDFTFEIIVLLKNIFILGLCSIVAAFILREEQLQRTFHLQFIFISFALIVLHKYFLRHFLIYLRRKGKNLRTLVIVGAGPIGMKFVDTVEKNSHFGYKIAGFLDDEKKETLNGQYLGKLHDLETVLFQNRIDEVVLALPNYATLQIEKAVRTCEKYTTRVKIIPDYFDLISSKYSISTFGSFPVISVREDRVNEIHWRMLKRMYDFMFTAFSFLFVFSWLWPIIAIVVKLDSKGPVIFKQERWGRDNKKFMTYKFRTMQYDESDSSGLNNFKQASRNDPRITRVGKFLRKTNLDELPQFYNVVKGDMSLIGPRPHPTPLNKASRGKIKLYMMRHLVKPGITGWAQVHGFRGETKEPKLMQKRIDYDIWYIENWSFALDIQIMIITIWNMIRGDSNAY